MARDKIRGVARQHAQQTLIREPAERGQLKELPAESHGFNPGVHAGDLMERVKRAPGRGPCCLGALFLNNHSHPDPHDALARQLNNVEGVRDLPLHSASVGVPAVLGQHGLTAEPTLQFQAFDLFGAGIVPRFNDHPMRTGQSQKRHQCIRRRRSVRKKIHRHDPVRVPVHPQEVPPAVHVRPGDARPHRLATQERPGVQQPAGDLDLLALFWDKRRHTVPFPARVEITPDGSHQFPIGERPGTETTPFAVADHHIAQDT
jgi:hypothetical protein